MKRSLQRRFFWILGINLFILILLYLIFFFMQFGPYFPTEYWIRDAYILKRHIAQNIKEKKISIISGSNALFGIDSYLIEKSIGIKTVNMAVHGGLSLDYILDFNKLCLNPGDIAVLPLEYPYYCQPRYINDLTLEIVIAFDREYFKNLSIWRKIKFISSCSPLRVFTTLYHKYVNKSKRHLLPAEKIIAIAHSIWMTPGYSSKNLYSFKNMNTSGDIKKNKSSHARLIKPRMYGKLNALSYKITSHSRQVLKSFVNLCRARDVKIFFTWPCTLKSRSFDIKNPVIQKNLVKLKDFLKKLGVEVLGEPEDFYYEIKFFFNTPSHLNREGRKIRTQKLISYLLQKLP